MRRSDVSHDFFRLLLAPRLEGFPESVFVNVGPHFDGKPAGRLDQSPSGISQLSTRLPLLGEEDLRPALYVWRDAYQGVELFLVRDDHLSE
jgi:hypothetical protein